ncbi:oxidoreductase [Streptomyces avermitilis]|uniref:Oxidoreductase n=2 Tax=Streptomyces avermitilis TaxID=33903 RepID=Q82PB8_STRAW|nr:MULTISPECIES: CBS domain-containing protein [Streptomyces]KUN54866.1 oxidoreductase [Streptomyces avermitilis]MYS96640.1 CBS domain-containing protein [Streptomyces sp. SID5469]OOV20900.1 oxidoreductase [Streptomyces avermitilis]BAC68715.1 putative oxidoreductase [Streptomyces avermitilis MA-4680 = NBRC 14893]BBJ48632.1 oxidoreductase [Streptomyces avermitilis]
MAQLVREIMTSDITMVEPQTSVVEVARLMREQDIGAVVVAENGRLRGLVTDRDLVVRALADGGSVDDRTVYSACSAELVSVAPDDDVDRAVYLMGARAVRRMLVVEDGRLVGIVSLGDVAVARHADSALGDISAADPNH